MKKLVKGFLYTVLAIIGALVVFIAMIWFQPVKTEEISGANSVAILEEVNLGGVNQSILIRGKNKSNPILLKVNGGPGTGDMLFSSQDRELENHFTVVHWDQRGTGKSYNSEIPKDSMTVDQIVSDTQELTSYLKETFNQEKIYLMGISFGTMVALKEVQAHPEDYFAYIGVSQVVNMNENASLAHEYLLKKTSAKDLKKLEEIDMDKLSELDTAKSFASLINKYGGSTHTDQDNSLFDILFSPEYSGMDFIRYYKGAMFSLEHLLEEVYEYNLTDEIQEVEVPVYLISGKYDKQANYLLAEKLFESIKAPKKEMFVFEKSAHSPHYEEKEKFNDLLINNIVKETYQVSSK